MHSMQAGYLEKAQKYTDKALMQLEKLKSKLHNWHRINYTIEKILFEHVYSLYLHIAVLDCSPILSTFQVILLEHIIMCRLVTGHKATALQEVNRFFHRCLTNTEQQILLIQVHLHVKETLTRISVYEDLTGLSAVPTVSQVIHQSCCSASHATSELFRPVQVFHLQYVCTESKTTRKDTNVKQIHFLHQGYSLYICNLLVLKTHLTRTLLLTKVTLVFFKPDAENVTYISKHTINVFIISYILIKVIVFFCLCRILRCVILTAMFLPYLLLVPGSVLYLSELYG